MGKKICKNCKHYMKPNADRRGSCINLFFNGPQGKSPVVLPYDTCSNFKENELAINKALGL